MAEQYKNQVFLPTLAEFTDDIRTSWELQKPLADMGYRPGFMLLERKDEKQPRVMNKEKTQEQFMK